MNQSIKYPQFISLLQTVQCNFIPVAETSSQKKYRGCDLSAEPSKYLHPALYHALSTVLSGKKRQI